MDRRSLKQAMTAHSTLAGLAVSEEIREYHTYFVKGLSMRLWGNKYEEAGKHTLRWVLFDSPTSLLNRFRGNGYRDGYNYPDLSSKRPGPVSSDAVWLSRVLVHPRLKIELMRLAKKYRVQVSTIQRMAFAEFVRKHISDPDDLFFDRYDHKKLTLIW